MSCDLSATELRRRLADKDLSPVELLERLSGADRDGESGRERRDYAGGGRSAFGGASSGSRHHARRKAGTAARAAGPHQGYAGYSRAAHHLRQPFVCGPCPLGRRRVCCPPARRGRDHPRKDQYAGMGGGRQHPQSRPWRDRQCFRPVAFGCGLLGWLRGSAGLRHGPAGVGLGHWRQSAQPRRLCRHRRVSSVLRTGSERTAHLRLVQSLDPTARWRATWRRPR